VTLGRPIRIRPSSVTSPTVVGRLGDAVFEAVWQRLFDVNERWREWALGLARMTVRWSARQFPARRKGRDDSIRRVANRSGARDDFSRWLLCTTPGTRPRKRTAPGFQKSSRKVQKMTVKKPIDRFPRLLGSEKFISKKPDRSYRPRRLSCNRFRTSAVSPGSSIDRIPKYR